MKFSEYILNEDTMTRNQAQSVFKKTFEKVFKEFVGLSKKYDVKIDKGSFDKEELSLQFDDWYMDGKPTSLLVTFLSNEFAEDPKFTGEFIAVLKKECKDLRKFMEMEKEPFWHKRFPKQVSLYYSLNLPKIN